MIDQSVGAWIW